MVEGFRTIFWGIFFVTFHINLGPIAILPLFVGYMIVSRGINHLREEFDTVHFEKARRISFWLTLLGVFSFLLIWSPVQNTILLSYYPLLFSILELLLVYNLLEGSIERFITGDNKDVADNYRSEQRTYIVFMTIYIIGMCIAITIGENTLAFVMLIIGLFLRLWLMVMLGRLKRSCGELPETPTNANIPDEDDMIDVIRDNQVNRFDEKV